jgi:hypothetical protein
MLKSVLESFIRRKKFINQNISCFVQTLFFSRSLSLKICSALAYLASGLYYKHTAITNDAS